MSRHLVLHALNTCKILQITLLSLLAPTAVYTAVFISANFETISRIHFISVLVIFHKKISIFHQVLFFFFQVRFCGTASLFGSQGRPRRSGSGGIYAFSCLFLQPGPRYGDRQTQEGGDEFMLLITVLISGELTWLVFTRNTRFGFVQ